MLHWVGVWAAALGRQNLWVCSCWTTHIHTHPHQSHPSLAISAWRYGSFFRKPPLELLLLRVTTKSIYWHKLQKGTVCPDENYPSRGTWQWDAATSSSSWLKVSWESLWPHILLCSEGGKWWRKEKQLPCLLGIRYLLEHLLLPDHPGCTSPES